MSESGEKSGELVTAAIESDSELHAIRVMLGALVPLKQEARSRVVDYVLERLGMLTNAVVASSSGKSAAGGREVGSQPSRQTDIRALTAEKSPRSANDMAALVAYYLSEAAPEADRKETINTEDIRKYFKQANFHLPRMPRQTLVNAKNAGYFESVGGGQYRLNPVGYNLVVHNLPAGSDGGRKPGQQRRRSGKKKPSTKRKNRT
jgi:hypothetical protein